jgi:hypothetical protein
MLVSQGAQAFTSVNMPCSQDHMMMQNMIALDTQSSLDSISVMDNSDMNCCAKDCCCPAGVVTVAVVINHGLAAVPNFTETKVASFIVVFKSIFPSQLQRPPKSLTV